MLFQRRSMGDPPYARPAVAATGGRGGFNGLSGRRRVDNDAGVHHNMHAAVTADTAAIVTAGNVTAGNVTVGNFAAATAATATAGNVTAGNFAVATTATVTAGNVTTVTAAAVTVVTAATVTAFTSTTDSVTAVSDAVLGAAAGVWPYPLEDGPIFRHANDALLGNAGRAAALVASEKRRGFQSQRWPPVHD